MTVKLEHDLASRMTVAPWGYEPRQIAAQLAAALDALDHATCSEGDHLSIASRRMVDTVMEERDALRQKVRDLEAEIARMREVAGATDGTDPRSKR